MARSIWKMKMSVNNPGHSPDPLRARPPQKHEAHEKSTVE